MTTNAILVTAVSLLNLACDSKLHSVKSNFVSKSVTKSHLRLP